ncbi:MAG: type II toxin-antitoxin system RelE/ParE family toxin [Fusobacteriaceae bacterium]|jgi:proteic killer suppression protein|nr:type II toxin-antitoxin system RelE/ParE family toxin [Fusobacteriaceae bacterium]
MKLRYHDNKIEKLCKEFHEAQRKLGSVVAKKLHAAIAFFEKAGTMSSIAENKPLRLHKLQGDRQNTFAIVLGSQTGFRLIIEPLQENGQLFKDYSDMALVYKNAKTILVLEVTNHYE